MFNVGSLELVEDSHSYPLGLVLGILHFLLQIGRQKYFWFDRLAWGSSSANPLLGKKTVSSKRSSIEIENIYLKSIWLSYRHDPLRSFGLWARGGGGKKFSPKTPKKKKAKGKRKQFFLCVPALCFVGGAHLSVGSISRFRFMRWAKLVGRAEVRGLSLRHSTPL